MVYNKVSYKTAKNDELKNLEPIYKCEIKQNRDGDKNYYAVNMDEEEITSDKQKKVLHNVWVSNNM